MSFRSKDVNVLQLVMSWTILGVSGFRQASMARTRLKKDLIAGVILLAVLSGVLGVFHFYGTRHTLSRIRKGYLQIYARRILCETQELFRQGTAAPYQCEVDQALAQYRAMGFTYKENLEPYSAFGDWLNFSRTYLEAGVNGAEDRDPAENVDLDSDYIPVASYNGRYVHNPVNVALYALSQHGCYLRGEPLARERFLKAADQLIKEQDSGGALRNPFPWHYYLVNRDFQPGWPSAMAQGLALSVFARAYQTTGDRKYLTAGDKAFSFLLVPISRGGVMDTLANIDPALSRKIIFEEYPTMPSGHTLNGFMYTMLGLYDWSKSPTPKAQDADRYFHLSIDTLRHILPYYDLGRFTSYDLGHLVHSKSPHIGVNYHAVHIFLLHALVSVTEDPILREYEKKWESYVPR